MVESLVYGLGCDTLLSLFITWFGSSVDLATTCKNVLRFSFNKRGEAGTLSIF